MFKIVYVLTSNGDDVYYKQLIISLRSLRLHMESAEVIVVVDENTYENIPELCYSAGYDEVAEKGFTLVPSRYIEFVNRDENIDFDTKMKTLQSELRDLLVQEERSKEELLGVFKELGYEIKL